MRHPHAAVLGRRQEQAVPGWFLWSWIVAVAMTLLMLTAPGVRAQTAVPPPATAAPTLPPGSGSDSAAPAPQPNSRPNSADTPGGSTRNGVAVPPNQDPGIVAPTPQAGSGMPVIRPPGAPGTDTTVVPK